jgi:hypothetical protein
MGVITFWSALSLLAAAAASLVAYLYIASLPTGKKSAKKAKKSKK